MDPEEEIRGHNAVVYRKKDQIFENPGTPGLQNAHYLQSLNGLALKWNNLFIEILIK